MRNLKKSKKEKAETRAAQNKRAAEKKKAAGLTRVSLWVPEEILQKCGLLERVGVIFAADKSKLVSAVLDADGLHEVSYQPNLLQ